jgi:hypothetical protein
VVLVIFTLLLIIALVMGHPGIPIHLIQYVRGLFCGSSRAFFPISPAESRIAGLK